MTTFYYKAATATGQWQEGTREGTDENAVVQQLQAVGLVPVYVGPSRGGAAVLKRQRKHTMQTKHRTNEALSSASFASSVSSASAYTGCRKPTITNPNSTSNAESVPRIFQTTMDSRVTEGMSFTSHPKASPPTSPPM